VRHGSSVVEVATFRSDDVYLDGRRPSKVHFTTAQEDAKRRDFTINGLFLDPIENRTIDYVNGLADLSARVLRAIGDPSARFAEDHLRLLRAVRFAARFGLAIEPDTAHAIQSHAQQLKAISPERIAEELRLMLAPPTRNTAWRLLNQFGLTEVVFRFAMEQPATAPDTQHQSILLHLGHETVQLGLALAAMAVSVLPDPWRLFRFAEARSLARNMRKALRFANDESDELEGTLGGIGMILTDVPAGLATRKRFLARPTAASSRRLMQAIATAGFFTDAIHPLLHDLQNLANTGYAPVPLITGDDLTAAGLMPGPAFKRILASVYDAQLEDRISTWQEAMHMALYLAGQPR
jgi:poly(A) polymerase